ncbi:MAG: hypothetical protein VR68_12300 [Peptococcaceae bacterium BRH_c4a]|nr:MAG: hypothetical protein VR68_12300 [Peptococcaceae bacterium BRH_c4a]
MLEENISYTYDGNGNLLTVKDTKGTITRDYDAAGQILQQKDVDGSRNIIVQYDYTYDPAGNITTEQEAGNAAPHTMEGATMTYTSDNRLATYNGRQAECDSDGNMTKGPLGGAMGSYTYDSRNRLTSAGSTAYRYDAENNRTGVTVNGSQTGYVINPNILLSQVLISTGEKGNQTCYVYGLGLIGQEEQDGSYKTYHYDLRGSTVALTDQSGNITDRFIYGPYGELAEQEGKTATPFLFSGNYGVMTDDNGLYHMRARYYDPATSRMLTEDPARAGLNWYTYCNNNPINFIDPQGLDAILINKPVDNAANNVGVEHMGGFFQDENDDWWFFFWGDTVKYVEVDDSSIFDSMDAMNEWLVNNQLLNADNPYRDSVYIKGDFTASHNGAQELLESYEASLGTWDGKGLSNQEYNVLTNNCGQVTMSLFEQGTLPSGTNVGDYMTSNGYGTAVIPNWNMINMQAIFYNKATNLAGFEAAMKTQRAKYEGQNSFTQWWYTELRNNINTISKCAQ